MVSFILIGIFVLLIPVISIVAIVKGCYLQNKPMLLTGAAMLAIIIILYLIN